MIYYSHVNEDNRVERNALMARPARHLYAVAGSGERVIALMDCPSLESVHFIDNNWDALYLCELKMAALDWLPVDDYLSFIGFSSYPGRRYDLFEAIKPSLSESCRSFWETRKKEIEMGICNCGHFEQFLHRAHPVFRFFLGKSFYQCFWAQKADWQGFPNLRWGIVKAFFSYRWTYRLFGMKDTAFISSDSNLKLIPDALQQSLDEDGVGQSALFHLVFNGNLRRMPEENLPPSFQKDVLQRIKNARTEGRLKVHFQFGDVLEVLQHADLQQSEPAFFSLSDILSFVSWDYQQELIRLITAAGSGGDSIVFRAFVRKRLTEQQVNDLYANLRSINGPSGRVKDLTAEEQSHFYQVFQINC